MTNYPKDFLWGAATAAYQVEGGNVLSDWWKIVRGYLHWSARDNYEWGHWAPTFGPIAVDRTTFERQPKPSLAWLGELARTAGARLERVQ